MSVFGGVDWVYVRIRPILWSAGLVAGVGLSVLLYQHSPLYHQDRQLVMEEIALTAKVLFQASGYAAADEVLALVQEGEIHLTKARQFLDRQDYSSARSHAFLARSLGEKALARSGHGGVSHRQANFFRIKGKVTVRRSGRLDWQSADILESLLAGDTIKTAAGGLAEIIYTDGRITTLGPSSLMEIQRAVADADADSRRLDIVEILSNGTLQITPASTAAPDSTHRVNAGTVSASASIHDTEMKVAYDAQAGTTSIDVNQGAVRLTTADSELSLWPGTRIQVDAQGRAGLPQPILAGPRLLTPEEGRVFRYVDPKLIRTVVSWSPVAGATGYRLEAGRHPQLPEPEVVLLDLHETSTRLPPLAPGWWFWRVAAFNDKEQAGRASAAGSFQISPILPGEQKDVSPPALVLAELLQIGSIVILTGTTESLATLEVQGRWVIPEEDGKFTATVHLPHTGKNTITTIARDLSGNETTVRRDVYLQE